MSDYRSRRRDRLSPENNGEAGDLDTSGSPSRLDVGNESRVAARRRERAAATAQDAPSPGDGDSAEARGATGGGGSSARKGKTDKKDASSKGSRFAHRKTREKRRGTGLVVLQDDDTTTATEGVRANTEFNEDVSKKGMDGDHNGATNSYETPSHRRQGTPIREDEANGGSEGSRIRSRRRQGRESHEPSSTASPSSPRSILRREVDGRTAEEWKRMYEREHRENRRLTRRLHESEERIARLEDEIQILTEDLEGVDEELDRSREENRALNKAMSGLRS